jgi:hypothetical protein
MDEPEQDAPFQIEGPTRMTACKACSPHGRGVWCLNRGPEDKLVEVLSQWLTQTDADER